jgi:hypothetical protein
MLNNHTTESSTAGDSSAAEDDSYAGAMTTTRTSAVGESSSSALIPATSAVSTAVSVSVTGAVTPLPLSTSAAPVAGTSAAEITAGANRLASELREFMQLHEQSCLVTSSTVSHHNDYSIHMHNQNKSGGLESIGSASWPAVKEDATADLQLATCRKLREVS